MAESAAAVATAGTGEWCTAFCAEEAGDATTTKSTARVMTMCGVSDATN